MTTTILALDLGTTTGWAMRPRGQQVAHGFVTLRPQRCEGGGMRYLRFKRWLTGLKGLTTDIQAVYFEEVRRHVGVDAAHVYGGLMATLTSWCEHNGIPYQGAPVGTIKKHATGKGNAGKEEVMAAMRSKGMPWPTTTRPMRWRFCTGPSTPRRSYEDPAAPLPLAPGPDAAHARGPGRRQATRLAGPEHPRHLRERRAPGLLRASVDPPHR